MKIVVIGGSGLIGKKLVQNLRQQGHEVVAASPSIGCQRRHWRGTGASGCGRSRGRRCGELAVVRGQGRFGVLRKIGSQSPPRGSSRRRRTSRGAVGRRHRPPARQWLLPREAGPGESDQGLAGSSGAASIRKLQWGQAARPARRRGDRQQEIVKLNSKVRVRDERERNVRASRSTLISSTWSNIKGKRFEPGSSSRKTAFDIPRIAERTPDFPVNWRIRRRKFKC